MSEILARVIINRILESMVRDEIVNTAYIDLQFHEGTLSLQDAVFSH